MSDYTTTVRALCWNLYGAGTNWYDGTYTDNQILDNAAASTTGDLFPLYSNVNWWEDIQSNPETAGSWNEFKKRFLRHFWMREINADTCAMWSWYMHDTIPGIVSKYNPLLKYYASHIIDLSKPREISDVTTTTDTGSNSDVASSTGSDETKTTRGTTDTRTLTYGKVDTSLHSDTPQGSVNIASNDYISDIDKSTLSGTDKDANAHTGTDTVTYTPSTVNTVNHIFGHTNTVTKNINGHDESMIRQIREYADNMISVYKMIFDECENELFIQLW